MKNKNLILLALVGLGIYWYLKNKNKPTTTTASTVAPDTSNVKPTVVPADVDIKFSINGMRKLGNVPNII
jgi:lipopolysaccharide export system protein LptC